MPPRCEGLLYKRKFSNSTKKLPVIFIFYERDADNLYNYIEPSNPHIRAFRQYWPGFVMQWLPGPSIQSFTNKNG